MRYRGSSKIKTRHGLIPGLLKFLKKIEDWEEITAINPGVITQRRSSGRFVLRVQYCTESGVKCIARSGNAVQEVFFVSSGAEALEGKLIRLLNSQA